MLISENQLQKLIRQILLEQGSFSAAPEKVISVVKDGKGNYTYQIFSNGKIQIISKGGKQYPQPVVLNQQQAQAVAKEQIAMGNKGTVIANIANGTLVAPAAAPAETGGSSSFGGQEFSQSAQFIGRGGWKYQVYNNGKIDVVAQGKRVLNPPTTLDAAKAKLVAAELQKMGNKSQVVASIAAGTLTYEATGSTQGAAAPATPGFVFLGRGGYDAVGDALKPIIDPATAKTIGSWVSNLTGQGHGFIMIVDPKDGVLHRFDFGRYKKEMSGKKGCEDTRLSSLGDTLANAIRGSGLATTGIVLYKRGAAAKFSPDRKQILNIPQILRTVKKPDEKGQLECLLIPVSNASGALSLASSMANKCYNYAIPGAAALQNAMNCGTFAQKILQYSQPVGIGNVVSVETATLIDTPDHLFQTAEGDGYQKFTF